MRIARFFSLICLAGGVACSGKSVNLDSTSGVPGAAGSAGTANAPVLVFEQHGAPLVNELLVDETRLYWQNQNFVFQGCLKTDCQNSLLTYSTTSDLNGTPNIAVSAGNVFWLGEPSHHGEIDTCPSSGCAGEPLRLIQDPNVDLNSGLVGVDGSVYWRSTFDLYRCAASGCQAAPELVSLSAGKMPTFAGGYAYWTSYTDTSLLVQRAPKDGSAPLSTVYETASTPTAMAQLQFAVTSDTLYLVDANDRILSCPASGCDTPNVVLDDGVAFKGYVQADASGVYWLETAQTFGDSSTVLHFCATAGCASGSSTVAGPGVVAYALDADSVYWIDQVPQSWQGIGGEIHRIAKASP
jgi:hypothetical protein